MHNAVQHQSSVSPARSRISLAMIAEMLDVPVVVVSHSDVDANRTHSAFGLDFGIVWSEFSAAVDAQCTKGATIIPNVEVHPELSRLSRPLVERNIRFLVAIPLCDVDGWRLGSIAVLADQKSVASRGIPIRRLGELGREFIGLSA